MANDPAPKRNTTAEAAPGNTEEAMAGPTAEAARNTTMKAASNPASLAAPATGGDKLANYLTMVGHLCADINQGAIMAVLPFLVASNGYSYTAVAMLVFAVNIASAIIQPLFGWLGDKYPCPWLMALGVFLAGLGMAGVGVLDGYGLTVISAGVCGTGVAMFHPEGGRLANLAAGEHKGSGMSIFAVGGNLGFFFGPILATIILSACGMRGTLLFLIPSTLCALFLLALNKRFVALGVAQKQAAQSAAQEHWPNFSLVMVVLSLRATVQNGLMAFAPLVFLGVFGMSEETSSLMLSVFALAGAVATILSGRVCERFGVFRVAPLASVGSLIALVFFATGHSLVGAILATILLPMFANIYFPATVAKGMEYVPAHLGMASALSYGVAIAIGGIAEPFLGMAGDYFGITSIAWILVVLQVVLILFVLITRRSDRNLSAEKEMVE